MPTTKTHLLLAMLLVAGCDCLPELGTHGPVVSAPGPPPAAPAPANPPPELVPGGPLGPWEPSAITGEHTLARDISLLPPWSHRNEAYGTGDRGHRSTVAQLRDPASAFIEMLPTADTRITGLLLCRIEVRSGNNWDTPSPFGDDAAPDVTLRVTVGDQPAVTIRGPEDSHSFYASIPNVVLSVDDGVEIVATDRDTAFDDDMETVVIHAHQPLAPRASGTVLLVECRIVDGAWATERATPLLTAADQALERLEGHLTPAADGLHTELPIGPRADVERSLHPPASFLGWSHPEVHRRLVTLHAYEERFHDAVEAMLAERVRTAPPPGQPVRIPSDELTEASVTELSCEVARVSTYPSMATVAPPRCIVTVEATIAVSQPLGFATVPSAALLHPRGYARGLVLVAIERDGQRLADTYSITESGTYTLVFGTPTSISDMGDEERPGLLRIQSGLTAGLVRIE